MKSIVVKVTLNNKHYSNWINVKSLKMLIGYFCNISEYKPRKRVCRWVRDTGDSRRFFTECNNTHNFYNFLGIYKNGFNACPYCGGEINKARAK
jgi:formamidopyrimidine-DNA glycosylase